ncbi:MAG: purine-nucleoside phosphorylase [Atribacterota bacterium]
MEKEQALLRFLYPPDALKKIVAVVSRFPRIPFMSIIAGSGWKDVVEGQVLEIFSYQDFGIPFHHDVEGHSDQVRLLEKDNIPILVFGGRLHLYQGYRYEEIVLPVIVSFLSGVKVLLITNAAGSLHWKIPPGNLCLLTDQVDFTFVPDPPVFRNKPCFSAELCHLAWKAAQNKGFSLFQGTYVGVLGPSFETPAEIRMLARFGQVVGMSTVKETKMAANLGLPVCGFSLVTNWGSGMISLPLSHQEVLELSLRSKHLMQEFTSALIQEVSRAWRL